MSVQNINVETIVSYRQRNDQTRLAHNDPTWHNVAREREASGQSLAPLNPLPEGNGYLYPLAVTESESRNRPGFFVYRVIGVVCNADGVLLIPGTGKVTDNEKLASVSLSMIPSDAIFCDEHLKQIVATVTTAGRTTNNTTIDKKKVIQSSSDTVYTHEKLKDADATTIQAFQSVVKEWKNKSGKEPTEAVLGVLADQVA